MTIIKTCIRKWGNSRGAILQQAALDQLGFELGDEIKVIKVDSSILLKPVKAYTLKELVAGDSRELYALNDEDRETSGVVLCHQMRSVAWPFRDPDFIEKVPQEIVDAALVRINAIFKK